MKMSVFNNECNVITADLNLDKDDITEIYYNALATKSGKSFWNFNLYLKPDNHKAEFDCISQTTAANASFRLPLKQYTPCLHISRNIDDFDSFHVDMLTDYTYCGLLLSGNNEVDHFNDESVMLELSEAEKILIMSACLQYLIDNNFISD
jgi:hypothetical protein